MGEGVGGVMVGGCRERFGVGRCETEIPETLNDSDPRAETGLAADPGGCCGEIEILDTLDGLCADLLKKSIIDAT